MDPSLIEPGIFRHPRPKKNVPLPPSKKRKIEHKLEEISFDNDARADYLTGFHKRKVQRSKQAQAEAIKKAREERVVMRKQLREERKQELNDHVEAVNRALREAAEEGFGFDDKEDEPWGGISEDEDEDGEKGKKIELPVVDHEEEYVDEDKYTTVTIEAVNVSKEGLKKAVDGDESEEEYKQPKKVEEKKSDGKKVWPKKVRKKKFTYESKAERRATAGKQKASKKAKADARRGDT